MTVSDNRCKTNVININSEDACAILKQLQGVYFNYVGDPNQRQLTGMIAQDVQEVIPSVVVDMGTTTVYGVDYDHTLVVNYSDLVSVTIEAVKDVDERVDAIGSNGLSIGAPGITFPALGSVSANFQFAWSQNRMWAYVNGVAQGPFAVVPDIPTAFTATPTMDGVGAPGTSTAWARGDHVHPSDTKKLSLTGGILTGSLIISNAPICSISASATQAIVASTPLKVNFDTVEFDTTNAFDLTVHRFKPTVPGYYQVNCSVGIAAQVNTLYSSIYKNGTEYRRSTSGSNATSTRLSIIAHLNGTTDYLEGYVFANAQGTTSTNSVLTSFSASLMQASAN
jgi:hypothetical protein